MASLTRRLTVTVTNEDGTVLDSGEVHVDADETESGQQLAAKAIAEADWYKRAGTGWPDLDPHNDKK